MSTTLLQPAPLTSPETTLTLSQKAPSYLSAQSTWSLPYPLSLLLPTPESQEKWAIHENLFLASLRSGDHPTAERSLAALTTRFGNSNEHIMALQGLFEEATATSDADLQAVLANYEEVLSQDASVFPIRKRRIALLRSMGKTSDAIAALTSLLDSSPTDAEAWGELADLYVQQGLFEQATYCLEEVLLVTPNAWNMHARLGEVTYTAANRGEAAGGSGEQLKMLSESMRRFCRSVELCDDYLRGFYGLKLSTGRLLEVLESGSARKGQQVSSDPVAGDLAPPTVESVKKLNELATAKLAEIVRRAGSGEKGWDGYSEAELKAARELVGKDAQKIER